MNQVVMIGAGKLSTQLSKVLHTNGINILQIYSRTETPARNLAKKTASTYTSNLKDVVKNADLYIFAVADQALPHILKNLNLKKKRFVHTAGSISMNVFKNYTLESGVFYPLQTFSKLQEINFSDIPICIEATTNQFQKDLTEFGKKISNRVLHVDSQQRMLLHIAAIFSCNFTNHMYSIGKKLLENSKLDFELLKPLISETAQRIQHLDPLLTQTGPAIRCDLQTLKKHENELKSLPDFQKLYRFVSKSIFNMHLQNQ